LSLNDRQTLAADSSSRKRCSRTKTPSVWRWGRCSTPKSSLCV
jgi:hypothetical protein